MFTTKEVNFSNYGVLVCCRLWISAGNDGKAKQATNGVSPSRFFEKRCTYDVMSSECERLGPFTDILVSLYSRGVSYKWTQNHR